MTILSLHLRSGMGDPYRMLKERIETSDPPNRAFPVVLES